MKQQKKTVLPFLAVAVLLMGVASASAGYLHDLDQLSSSSIPASSIEDISSEELPSSDAPSISEELSSIEEPSSIVSSEAPSSQTDLLPLNDALPTIPNMGDAEGIIIDFRDQAFLSGTGWANYTKKSFSALNNGNYNFAPSYSFSSNSIKYYSYLDEANQVNRKTLALGWTSTSLASMEMKHPGLEHIKASGKNYVYLETQFFTTDLRNYSIFGLDLTKDGLSYNDMEIYLREKGSSWFKYVYEGETLPEDSQEREYQILFVCSSSNVNFRVEAKYLIIAA